MEEDIEKARALIAKDAGFSGNLDQDITACLIKMEKIRHESIAVFDKLMATKDFQSLEKYIDATHHTEEVSQVTDKVLKKMQGSSEGQETTKLLKEFLVCMVELNFLITTKGTEHTLDIINETGVAVWAATYHMAIQEKTSFFDMFQIYLNKSLHILGNGILKDWNQVAPNTTIH